MSYRVEYTPELRNLYPKMNKRTFPTKSFATIAITLIALYTLKSTGVLYWIIPGDHAVTTGAFTNMVDQVRSGQTVFEAIISFVRNVIEGGMP